MARRKLDQKPKPKPEEEQTDLFPGGPTVAKLEDADVLASLSAFARAFGTDRETLRRCLLEHDAADPVAVRGGSKLYALRVVYQAWTEGSGETDPDKMTPFKRRAWYQGEREKLHLQVARGELVESIEFERLLGQINQLYVRGLETAQDVIERDCGLTPQQAAKLEGHLDKVREDLYQTIVTGGSGDDEPAQLAEPAPAAARTAVPRETGSSAVDDGVRFLEKELAKGPKPTRQLIARGKKAGLSESTLRRAKAALGEAVEAARQSKGWIWRLAAS